MARGETLPDRTNGAALFADISGFTPLTEALTRTLGPRRGSEELTRQLNQVYDALIDEVNQYGGSVISFAGDAITCWFDATEARPAQRAVACALEMQTAMQAFAAVPLPDGGTITLAMKVAIASGPARRFLIGDEAIQLTDTLAGMTLERMASAEHLAQQGEVLVDQTTVAWSGEVLQIADWRAGETGDRFAHVSGLTIPFSEVTEPIGPPPPLSAAQASPWLMPPVYERLREGLGEILTELRPAVALFLRFEGLDYEGDDNAGTKLDAYIRWVQRVLARYEGYLLQLSIGDKGSYLYAALGAPLAHEDDARRAVSAALELRAPPAELSFVRSVQIGISQGTMRAGAYGGMTRRTYGVLGDEVNLAARLMQHAGPGEVLVGSHVQRAASAAFTWETLPPIRVKGKREPVKIARLVGRQQGQAEAALYTGALVGREAELAQLTQFVQPIYEGWFAGLMYVFGEPGMGKSRLVYELRQRLTQARGLSWFTCPAEGILRQSLNPFQHWLRQYFEQSAEHPEDRNKARFDNRLEALIADLSQPDFPAAPGVEVMELARELDRTRSFLGALAGGLRWEGSLYERVEPRLRLENTFTAFKILIQAESLRQPVVLHIEDTHWLDSDSEQLVMTLTRHTGSYPFAVLLTSRYRDDGSRYTLSVDEDAPQAAIDLNQLSPSGIRAMAAQVLGGELDNELAAFLADKTNGNPFFAEQLALDLRERGLLSYSVQPGSAGPGGAMVFAFTDQARVQEVPEGINAVLVARLDRLAAQVKAIVQTAAVLGREFEVWVLSQMLMNDERLPVKVKQAEAEAIWSALNETRYIFKHALLRDAAYDMQLQARLRELHALAGAAIEQVYADDLTPQAAILAYHWGIAGNTTKEGHYSARAGESALRISAFRDALRYFKRALALSPMGSSSEDTHTRTQLNYWMGEALAGLGELKEAQESLKASLALARANDDRKGMADGLSLLGGLTLKLGEVEPAKASLQEGLVIAREIQDQSGIANTLLRLGHIASARGEYAQAARYYEEGLSLARAVSDEMKTATALNGLGLVNLMLQNLETAQSHFQEAQTFFRAIGNRTGILMTLGNQGTVVSRLGQHAEANRLYGEAMVQAQEIGDRRLQAILLDNLGDVSCVLGQDNEAARYWKESLSLALEVGIVPSALLTVAGIARLDFRAGRHERALELLGLALSHPASDDEVKQRGEPLLAELRAHLPPDLIEAGLERGRTKTLEGMASEILKEN